MEHLTQTAFEYIIQTCLYAFNKFMVKNTSIRCIQPTVNATMPISIQLNIAYLSFSKTFVTEQL